METAMEEILEVNNETKNQPEAQPETPQSDKQTWNFEGKDYPLFLVDGSDSIAVPIKRNKDDTEPIGLIKTNFRWEKSEAFIDRLEYDIEDTRNLKENLVERHRANVDKLNADFFDRVAMDGELIRIVDGDYQPPVALTHENLKHRTTELKSNIVHNWLKDFHIERYFEKGMDELDALTSGTMDAIRFVCKIGDRKEPSNVLLMEFGVPNDDQRRAFADNRTKSKSKVENNVEVVYTTIDWARKYRYAKTHLRAVQGALVKLESGALVEVGANELADFKAKFNPDWFIQLGDALQDTFDIGGK